MKRRRGLWQARAVHRLVPPLLVAVGLAALGCRAQPREDPLAESREPCSDSNPLRNLYFGDLHVHTSYSFDAYVNEIRVDPFAAYDFARGQPVELPDGLGGTRSVRLERPLDFAAVTDHGEYLGEVAACDDPESGAYGSELCVGLRTGDPSVLVQWGLGLGAQQPVRPRSICDAVDCPDALAGAWSRTQAAAEQAYDRSSSCSFTSFVAYEWSGARRLSNLHRNVVFRTTSVPATPISYFEAPTVEALWRGLRDACIEGDPACDVLAIPHNSNWSNGNMFVVESPSDDAVELASLRAELEPLLEIYQHKGDSECMNGLSGVLGAPDELCEFEKLRQPPFEDCGDGTGSQGMINGGCVSRLDFARGILLEGLREQARLGVNPYKLGLMASTDTHNGTPGAVDEGSYAGHFGVGEAQPLARLTGSPPGGPRNSPGGLIAVWAEDNSRGALVEAMRRRETYGTSGPRMAVRLFGGWDLPEELCGDPQLVERGYELGVPMGADLPAAPAGAGAPHFVVQAFKDPGTEASPGRDLERIQIIKGWLDGDEGRVTVYDVAGAEGGSVDLSSCTPEGSGAAQLCAQWSDPDYDPSQPAWYYARVLEQPVCRWSTRDCNALAEAGDPLPEACTGSAATIRERAWTSPIWHPRQ